MEQLELKVVLQQLLTKIEAEKIDSIDELISVTVELIQRHKLVL